MSGRVVDPDRTQLRLAQLEEYNKSEKGMAQHRSDLEVLRNDNEIQQRRAAAIKAAWADPVKRQRILDGRQK